MRDDLLVIGGPTMTRAEARIISDDLIEYFAAREAWALELVERRTAECDAWRLMSLATMQHNVALTRDLDMLTSRWEAIHARLQDERDVWADQTDLRRGGAR